MTDPAYNAPLPGFTGIYRHQLHSQARDHSATATAYAAMTHTPTAFSTELAYLHFKHETMRQWHDLIDSGLTVEFYSEGDPYSCISSAMFADIETGHLWTLRTNPDDQGMPSDHPMLAPVGDGLLLNDAFRAVHDYHGHFDTRKGFGPLGEYAAWINHRSWYTQEALPALWCETRGQSAWTNFAPGHAELPMSERPFADQKAGHPPVVLV